MNKPPRFLEVDYGLWDTPVGMRLAKEFSINEIGVMILGVRSDSELEAMRNHAQPMKLLKEKYPEKLVKCSVNVDLYEHLDEYNYVFTVYGRSDPDIFYKPIDELRQLKTNALLTLSTIDDELWANPYAVLYHTPGVNRETYLGGHTVRSLAAVRNYLFYEDPECLNTCPESEIKALFVDLYKRGIVLRRGLYYFPSKMKRRARIKNKSKLFKPLHSCFAVLDKANSPVPSDMFIPPVIPLEQLLTERSVLRVYMDESSNPMYNKMLFGSRYFDTTIENQVKKLTINRIIFIFKSRQTFTAADRTMHYNHPSVNRLRFAAAQIQKLLPKRVIFNSFINN